MVQNLSNTIKFCLETENASLFLRDHVMNLHTYIHPLIFRVSEFLSAVNNFEIEL